MFKQVKRFFKGRHPQHNHDWSDGDRALSLEKRRLNREMKQMREKIELEGMRATIEDLKDNLDEAREYEGDDAEEPESMEKVVEQMLMKKLMQGFTSPPNQQNTPSSEVGAVSASIPPVTLQNPHISDDDILIMIGSVPKKHLKMANSMPDSVLKAVILKNAAVDEVTAERVIQMFRNGKV